MKVIYDGETEDLDQGLVAAAWTGLYTAKPPAVSSRGAKVGVDAISRNVVLVHIDNISFSLTSWSVFLEFFCLGLSGLKSGCVK